MKSAAVRESRSAESEHEQIRAGYITKDMCFADVGLHVRRKRLEQKKKSENRCRLCAGRRRRTIRLAAEDSKTGHAAAALTDGQAIAASVFSLVKSKPLPEAASDVSLAQIEKQELRFGRGLSI